jgi:flagellar biosynthesis/type III secretory pathway M-ring protein FliF/YscJ
MKTYKNKKGVGFVGALVILLFIMLILFFISTIVIRNVIKETENNETLVINMSDPFPIPADSPEEFENKLKDPTIALPEFIG